MAPEETVPASAAAAAGKDEVADADAADDDAAAPRGSRVEEVPHESADPARAQGTRADGGQDLRGVESGSFLLWTRKTREVFEFFFFHPLSLSSAKKAKKRKILKKLACTSETGSKPAEGSRVVSTALSSCS